MNLCLKTLLLFYNNNNKLLLLAFLCSKFTQSSKSKIQIPNSIVLSFLRQLQRFFPVGFRFSLTFSIFSPPSSLLFCSLSLEGYKRRNFEWGDFIPKPSSVCSTSLKSLIPFHSLEIHSLQFSLPKFSSFYLPQNRSRFEAVLNFVISQVLCGKFLFYFNFYFWCFHFKFIFSSFVSLFY